MENDKWIFHKHERLARVKGEAFMESQWTSGQVVGPRSDVMHFRDQQTGKEYPPLM